MENEKKYSNKDYKRLGDRIRSNPDNIATDDLLMLQELRLSYKEPLSIIFTSVEKTAHKVDKNSICTYRVKRIESIVSKLLRFPEMQVNRAEDIAGCRCIMSTTKDVYELYERIMKNKDNLPFVIKGTIHDYIKEPKASGYRSIHINAVLRDNDNRRIEIQLRALEHHNWATLVEITDLLFQTKLKENGKDANNELFEFHRLLAQSDETLTNKEQFLMADTIIKYDYIQTIGEVFARNYLDIRNQWNRMKLQRYQFFLISTGKDGIPDFLGFIRFDEAEKAYFDRFVNNDENRNIVLTHLREASFTKISIAYSNYFLTFNNTLIQILMHLSNAIVASYRNNKVSSFKRYYQSFVDIVSFWKEKQLLEVDSFKNDRIARNSLLIRTEWTNSIKSGIGALQHISYDMHKQLKFSPLHAVPYYIMKQKQKQLFQEHS